MANSISRERLKEILLKFNAFPRDQELGTKDNLFDLGILDSFSVLELITTLEEDLEIVFDFKDVKPENLQTIDDIISLLNTKYGR